MIIELVQGSRGCLLHIDGCLYYKTECKHGITKWNSRKKPACFASARTQEINGKIVLISGGPEISRHKNCAPNVEEVEALKFMASMKKTA